MHHAPAGPPFSARVLGAVRRSGLLARHAVRHRSGRLALGAAVSTVIVALVVAVPVVSGSGRPAPSVTFDASSSTTASRSSDSPVVMGRDGRPVSSSTFAGVGSAAASSASSRAGTTTPSEDAVVAAPGTTGSVPGTSSAAEGSTAAAGGTTSSGAPTAGSATSDPATSAPGEPSTEAPVTEEPTEAGSPGAAGAEDQVLAVVNQARAGVACPALVADGGLAALAQAHSADMRKDGVLGLLTADGGSVLDLGARAASVARGSTDTDAVVAGWLDGADGTAILDCGMTAVGVGVDRGGDGPWWTLLLA